MEVMQVKNMMFLFVTNTKCKAFTEHQNKSSSSSSWCESCLLVYNFYVLLTVHLSVNSVNDQLDAQVFYFIIRLLQSSTCFEQCRAHHQEVKLY